jgi:hypothetical protein
MNLRISTVFLEQFPLHGVNEVKKHALIHAPRLHIVTTGMITTNQKHPIGELITTGMTERDIGNFCNQTLLNQKTQQACVGTAPKGNDNLQFFKSPHFFCQVWPTLSKFFGNGLIFRRETFDGIGNINVGLSQAIICGDGIRLTCQTGLIQ